MKNSENGFSYVEILLFVVIAFLISFVGWFVWQSKNNANLSLNNAAKADSVSKITVTNKTASQAQTTPAPTPAPVTNVPSTATKKTTATPTNPAPTPVPAPIVLTPSLTISSDGCSVTANGSQGFTLYVSAHNSSKGGESTYTLPASATLTVQTGNVQGMTVDAILKNASGANLIEKTGTITPSYCY